MCITDRANRERGETVGLIGFFVNTLTLAASTPATLAFDALVDATQRGLIDAQSHQDVPFDQVVDALGVARSASHHPLFQVMAAYGARRVLPSFAEVRATELPSGMPYAKFDLALSFDERDDGGLDARFVYATDLFDADAIERFAARYVELLAHALDTPGAAIGDLPELGGAARLRAAGLPLNTVTDIPGPGARRPRAGRRARFRAAPAPGAVHSATDSSEPTMPNFMLFLATSIAITVAPGPDNLQVLARGISQGRAAGIVAALGFASGVLFHTTLAAFGVAALLRSSPVAFHLLKLAGGAYLIWIGIKALRSKGLATAHARAPQPLSTIFRQSVIGNLLNPKVTLFFVVFLPQFVDPHGAQPVALQMLELGALFMAQTAVVFSVFGVGAGAIVVWLKRRPRVGVWLDRLAGATFVALGLRVALKD